MRRRLHSNGKSRGVITGETEPNLAPDADPLAPEDSKSNSKQLKLKLSVWLVTNGILYHAFCQIVTGYGTQSLGLELCLLAAYTLRSFMICCGRSLL